MNVKKLDSQIIAGNVYQRWCNSIKSAKESIAIFTPYLDNTVVKLLENKPERLEFENITLILDFNPEYLITARTSLEALLQLFDMGIHIKHLKDLHAKILLVDNKYITLGSQNFTKKGKRNKESSIKLAYQISGTLYLDKIQNWISESEKIDRELVEKLLSDTGFQEFIHRYRALSKESQNVFTDLKDKLERRKRILALKSAEKKSRWRFESGDAYASIQLLPEGYYTLLANENTNLTSWESLDRDLARLYFYPILNLDSLKMGYARIAQSRITYIRDYRHMGYVVNHYPFDVQIWSVSCPQTNCTDCNLVVELLADIYNDLENNEYPHFFVELCIKYNGTDYKISRKNYNANTNLNTKIKKEFEKEVLSNSNMEKILDYCFSRFRYEELNVSNKNIRRFFDDVYYRLSIIEYANRPILIATAQQNRS